MILDAATPLEPDPSPPAPKPWPKWLSAADISLGILALVAGFLVTSFVARNADFWRHIATGRALVQGKYALGSDPFTYTGAERPWVNPNWLTELGLYFAYSVDSSGAIVVGLKAMLYAAAFGVLFLLRKSRFPVLPWSVAIFLGVLAAAPFGVLRPYVMGLLFEGVVLVLLYRGNWNQANTWRMPLITAAVVALWANCDAFAFLGTLTVVLLAVGEYLQGLIFKGRVETAEADDPFFQLPAVSTLGRTALLCAFALLLNPTFLVSLAKDPGEAIAQLVPIEFDATSHAEFARDRDFVRLTYAFGNKAYMDSQLLGNNGPTSVAIALFALSGLSLAASYRWVRVSQVLLWMAMLALALLVHSKFSGFAAIVSAFVLAANLNGLTQRAARATGRVQDLFDALSRLSRVLLLIAGVLACAATLPGWLQIRVPTVGYARYVDWGVDGTTMGLNRSAEVLQRWRTETDTAARLADVRGVLTSPDFGDACCWFAPAEKVFTTTRYRFHRHELADLLTIREALTLPFAPADLKAIQAGTFDTTVLPIQKVMAKYDAAYLCVTPFGRRFDLLTLNSAGLNLASTSGGSPKDGKFWHLDGRFLVVGLVDPPHRMLSDAMRWNPADRVFHPGNLTPSPGTEVVMGQRLLDGWVYEIFQRPEPAPLEAEDSKAFRDMAERFQQDLQSSLQYADGYRAELGRTAIFHLMLTGGANLATMLPPTAEAIQTKQPDITYALPLAAVKQAHAAIAHNPQDAQGYLSLAQAHTLLLQPDLTLSLNNTDSIRLMTVFTGYQRALARLPEGDANTSAGVMLDILNARHELALLYFNQRYFDAARAEVRKLTELRAIGGTKCLAYDAKIPELWDTLYFSQFLQQLNGGLQQAEAAIRAEVEKAGGTISPQIRNTIEQYQQIRQQVQADPYSLLEKNKMIDAADHPKNFYAALMKRSTASAEDGETTTVDTTSLAVGQLKRLNENLAKFESRIIESVKAQFRPGMPQVMIFDTFANNGLSQQAIKFFEELDENKRDLSLNLSYLELMYHLGRIEEAHRNFVAEAFEPNLQKDATAVQRLLNLQLQRELLLGDYFKAEQTAVQVLLAQFPPLSAAEKALAATPPIETTIAVFLTAGPIPKLDYEQRREALANRLLNEAVFVFRRGVMALLRGDTAEAARLFDLADQPQGVPLDIVGNAASSQELAVLLPKYRELLKKFAGPPPR